jgi:peptidoglycan/xylan/chitin deacetylase (PgdA/CDA1 family)
MSFLRELNRRQVVVLVYHGVLSGSDRTHSYLNDNFVSADLFEHQIRHISRTYRPVSLRRLVDALERGVPLPERGIVVTFDDGFANNYTVAFPILRKHSVPFTIFLTTGMIGSADSQLWSERVSRAVFKSHHVRIELSICGRECRFELTDDGAREVAAREILALLKRAPRDARDSAVGVIESAFGRPPLRAEDRERYGFLTWEQVREMSDAGVEFGSHTVTHPIVSTLDDEALAFELSASKHTIEQHTRQECYSFAYPNGGWGDFSERDKRAVRRAGYRCGLAVLGGLNRKNADLFALQRVNVRRQYELPMLDAAATGLLNAGRRLRERYRT